MDDLGDRIWAMPLPRALLTFGAFALVGPVVGGVLAPIISGVLTGKWEQLGLFLILLPLSLPHVVFVGYLVGTIPASIAGLFFATVDFGRQRSGPLAALLVGAVLGLGLTDIPALVSEGGWWDQLTTEYGFWGSVSATLVCWSICGIRRSPRITTDNEPHRHPRDPR